MALNSMDMVLWEYNVKDKTVKMKTGNGDFGKNTPGDFKADYDYVCENDIATIVLPKDLTIEHIVKKLNKAKGIVQGSFRIY